MKVHLIERVLARGEGIGEQRVVGRVRRLAAPLGPEERVDPDEIIVVEQTDRSFVRALQRAAGLIASCGDSDAHCRLLAMELGVPAVVGVGNGLDALQEGKQVVLDAKRGLVYERPAALMRPGRW
jgi:pyruvate kinase